jgi:hypothetical protein
MREKLAIGSVLLVLVSVPFLVFFYQDVYRCSRSAEKVFVITGVGNRGVWTLETVNGLNYWWKSFEPATIYIQRDDSVVFRFRSADVFHQFYVPELGIGPVDIDPGHEKKISFRAEKAGVFRYYCTSQCGGCHFYMQGWIVVTPPGEKPVTPKPITCRLCVPSFESPSEADPVALGEYLYQSMGCVTCHGPEGRGGIQNYNYLKKTVPAHDRTAAKIFLTDKEDREAFIHLIETGADLNNPPEPPDISRYRLVMTRFNAAVELIENGKNAARLDLSGPAPPLQMPAWKNKLNRGQIHALMAHFISLFPKDDDLTGEEV